MASTNKTTNYELSQYIGGDKPTYLGDYNSDMYKIDAQMKVNATAISSLSSDVSTAVSTANSASTTATNAQTTANSASTTATNAQTTANSASASASSALSTASTAQTTATNAMNGVTRLDSKLDISVVEPISQGDITTTGSGSIISANVSLEKNTDGSIAKICGSYDLSTNGSTGNAVIPTSLRPDEELKVNGVAIRTISNGGYIRNINNVTITIKTNGNIEIPYTYSVNTSDSNRVVLVGCPIYIKAFNPQD